MNPCCTCNNENQWPAQCLHCDNRGECKCSDLGDFKPLLSDPESDKIIDKVLGEENK